MHKEFGGALAGVQPTPALFDLARANFKDVWEQRAKQIVAAVTKTLRAELKKLDKERGAILDRIADAGNSAVVTAYEKRTENLEEKKWIIREEIKNSGKPKRRFEDLFELSWAFLANPSKLWLSDRLEDKKAVLKLVFPGHLKYVRNEGLRTPNLSL